EQPRWAADSSAILYYTPSARREEAGTLWEISALGGWPRRVASALGGGDISHDGRQIAAFQQTAHQTTLATMLRDGSEVRVVARLAPGFTYTSPRWAPDDTAIAFQQASDRGFDVRIDVVARDGGELQEAARYRWMKGFCWLGDGSGFVYSSSRGSTLLYP